MAYSTHSCSYCQKRFRSFDPNPSFCSVACKDQEKISQRTGKASLPTPPPHTVWQRMHPGEWVLLEISQPGQRLVEVGYLLEETTSHLKVWLPETPDRHPSIHLYRQDTVLGCYFLPQPILHTLLPLMPQLNKTTGSIRPLVDRLLQKNADIRACLADFIKQENILLWGKRTSHTIDFALTKRHLRTASSAQSADTDQ